MKDSRNAEQGRMLTQLFDKGVAAVVIGAALLVVPIFLGATPMFDGIAVSVRPVAIGAMTVGVLMLVTYISLQRLQRRTAPPGALAHKRALPAEARDLPTETPAQVAEPARPQRTRRAKAPSHEETVETAAEHLATRVWNHTVFERIEWRRFEALCEALFGQAGFQTRSQSHGPEGGVDIWLLSRNASGLVGLVRCRHWLDQALDIDDMREFYRVMVANGLKRGTYATSGTLTAEATQFARDKGINALDSSALLELIGRRTPDQQRELLKVAYEGEFWRPTCASCGVKMVEHIPMRGGKPHWSCSNAPRCQATLPMTGRGQ